MVVFWAAKQEGDELAPPEEQPARPAQPEKLNGQPATPEATAPQTGATELQLKRAHAAVEMARYYEDARKLAGIAAIAQDDHAISQRLHLGETMGNVNDADAACAQIADQAK